MNAVVIIKRGREKPIRNQHPWIFSGAIDQTEGNPQPGDIVTVQAGDGAFLARGYWNPQSQIQVRLLTWVDETIDDDWWRRMLQRAIAGRTMSNIAHVHDGVANAYRLVNAENDYLPGLVVDRYSDWLVLQALTLGIDLRKSMLTELLVDLLKPAGIHERSDVDVRAREGLGSSKGLLWGSEPPRRLEINDNGLRVLVDVRNGHKTGYYLDQTENRRQLYGLLLTEYSGHCRLLNLFSYTGGFGLHALAAGGVHAINVDSSRDMLELAEENIILNNLHERHQGESYELIQADVFQYVRDMAEQGEQYDIVVLDPPKLAQNQRQLDGAARGYKDLNLHAFKVLKPGGYLMTFSCSGAVSPDLFQKIIFGALTDAGRQAQIVRCLSAGDDHPVALTFPEGAYLKGLLLRVY